MVRLTTKKGKGYKEHELTISKHSPKNTSNVKCPRCGSRKVEINRKGYDYGDGATGGICFGPCGLLCGGMEKDKLIGECMSCGKKFSVSKSLKNEWMDKSKNSR